MSRGPAKGKLTKTDFVAKVRLAWNGKAPDWVLILAEQANQRTAAFVAQKIGYSSAVISHVFNNAYTGDLERVAEKARGAFMGAVVACPVLGEIARDRCLNEQKMRLTGASAIRARLYRACRAGCPHSRLKQE